jgi:multidrug efflux pump subunit AcrB
MYKSILKTFLGNHYLVNIILILVLGGGMFAYSTLVRETYPTEITNQISVEITYSDTGPQEIDESICTKLNSALEDLPGVESITTNAYNGYGKALIKCKDGYNLFELKDSVQTELDRITDFPRDADQPVVKIVKYLTYVKNIALTGDVPEDQLKIYAAELKKKISKLPNVDKVIYSVDLSDAKLKIDVSDQTLNKYDLTLEDIKKAIADNNVNINAGRIKTNLENFSISSYGRKYKAKDYRNIPIISGNNGAIVKLGQIANIYDTDEKQNGDKYFTIENNKPLIEFAVYTAGNVDMIKINKTINRFLEEERKTLPPTINISATGGSAEELTQLLNSFCLNAVMGTILVFILLLIFMDLRKAFWVALCIPFSVSGAFIVMAYYNVSINVSSLFGLIMIVGIIVDDGIVLSDSVHDIQTNNGFTEENLLIGAKRVFWPIMAAVITTAVAFTALLSVPGSMKQATWTIGIVAISALLFSLFECLFLLPVHLKHIFASEVKAKPSILNKIRTAFSTSLNKFSSFIYTPLLKKIIYFRYTALIFSIILIAVVLSLIINQKLQFVFFPGRGQSKVKCELRVQPGTPDSVKKKLAEKLTTSWKKVSEKYKADNGSKIDTLEIVSFPELNTISSKILLVPTQERTKYTAQFLGDEWSKIFGSPPEVISDNFSGTSEAPGLVYNISGMNSDNILQAAKMVVEKLKTYKGVYDVNTNYRYGERAFDVKLKPVAYNLKLTQKDIMQQIKNGFSNQDVYTIQRGADEVAIVLSFLTHGKNSIKYFQNMKIKTPEGYAVPLSKVAEIRLKQTPAVIERYDGRINVQVSAKINPLINNPSVINRNMKKKFISTVEGMYGVSFYQGGNLIEQQQIQNKFMITVPLILLIIYLIITLVLKSYIQPLIVLLTVPYAIVGALLTLMIFGVPFSMIAIFGLIALVGITVNDAIVMINEINNRYNSGLTLNDAVISGASRRFKAIFLTSITTFVGLMPMFFDKSTYAPYYQPIAVVIAFGVLFALLINLLLTPCFLVILDDIKRFICWYFIIPAKKTVNHNKVKD